MASGAQSDAASFGPGQDPPSGPAMVPSRPQTSHRPSASAPPPTPAGSGHSIVISNSQHIHVGSVVTLTPGRRQAALRTRPPEMTPAVTALLRTPTMVTDQQIVTVSRYLGYDWKEVARRLGFLGGELDQLEYKETNLSEVCHRMLYTWRERQSRQATVQALVKALWQERAYDAVFKLADTSS